MKYVKSIVMMEGLRRHPDLCIAPKNPILQVKEVDIC